MSFRPPGLYRDRIEYKIRRLILFSIEKEGRAKAAFLLLAFLTSKGLSRHHNCVPKSQVKSRSPQRTCKLAPLEALELTRVVHFSSLGKKGARGGGSVQLVFGSESLQFRWRRSVLEYHVIRYSSSLCESL